LRRHPAHRGVRRQQAAAPRELPCFPTRRSSDLGQAARGGRYGRGHAAAKRHGQAAGLRTQARMAFVRVPGNDIPEGAEEAWLERSEEHTSELQSRENIVCRLLLVKKTLELMCLN